jgi:hypothetical protein
MLWLAERIRKRLEGSILRLNLPEHPHHPPTSLRMHRQHVVDVGPVVAMSIAVAER